MTMMANNNRPAKASRLRRSTVRNQTMPWPKYSQQANEVMPTDQRSDDEDRPWGAIARMELANKLKGNMSASACNLVRFRCPAAWRMQLRSHACGQYFATEYMACKESAMKYLTMSAPHNPALAVVLDGSGLIQIGQLDKNEDLLQAGNRLYCQALNLLQQEIASPDAVNNGTIIAAIHVMQVCDMFTSMPMGDLSWRQHADGISCLLKARKTDAPSDEFRALLSGNFRMFGLWNGILLRKGINHVLPEHAGPLEDIAVRIPGALEDCDSFAMKSSENIAEEAQQLLTCLEEIEYELKRWSVTWYRNMRKPPFNLVQASSIPSLDSTSDVFSHVLDFTSLSNATDHILCTACLLLIRNATLEVKTRMDPRSKTYKIVKSINDCADSLCMSMPYLWLPDHNLFGIHSSLGPLMVAWGWYSAQPTSNSIVGRLQWCEDAANYCRVQRGFRMMRPDLGPRTLSNNQSMTET